MGSKTCHGTEMEKRIKIAQMQILGKKSTIAKLAILRVTAKKLAQHGENFEKIHTA